MLIKRILISVEIPNFLPWNRFSAVACVVKSFAEVLHLNGYVIFINEYDFDTVVKNSDNINSSNPVIQNKAPVWYKYFPKRLREAVKDIVLIRGIKNQRRKIALIQKPDCIISWISYCSANGYHLSKKWNIPLISIYDNPLIEEYEFQFGFKPFLKNRIEKCEKLMIENSEKVIVYSASMASYLEYKYSCKIEFYFKQFLDTSKINYLSTVKPSGSIKLVFIGSFFNWHKIDLLINVFEKLYAKMPQSIQLLLVGDGPEKENIKKRVSETSCKNDIIFTGYMDKDGLNELLKETHIGIIPNALWFHAPVKLFQYAAAGLAIIACHTPTIEFIIKDYKSGFALFETEAQMLEKLEFMILDKVKRSEMANLAQKMVEENYNNHSYLTFFENILANLNTPLIIN